MQESKVLIRNRLWQWQSHDIIVVCVQLLPQASFPCLKIHFQLITIGEESLRKRVHNDRIGGCPRGVQIFKETSDLEEDIDERVLGGFWEREPWDCFPGEGAEVGSLATDDGSVGLPFAQ
jgi:hypothetical protein